MAAKQKYTMPPRVNRLFDVRKKKKRSCTLPKDGGKREGRGTRGAGVRGGLTYFEWVALPVRSTEKRKRKGKQDELRKRIGEKQGGKNDTTLHRHPL